MFHAVRSDCNWISGQVPWGVGEGVLVTHQVWHFSLSLTWISRCYPCYRNWVRTKTGYQEAAASYPGGNSWNLKGKQCCNEKEPIVAIFIVVENLSLYKRLCLHLSASCNMLPNLVSVHPWSPELGSPSVSEPFQSPERHKGSFVTYLTLVHVHCFSLTCK